MEDILNAPQAKETENDTSDNRSKSNGPDYSAGPSFSNSKIIRGHISSLVKDAYKTEEALDVYNLIRKQR